MEDCVHRCPELDACINSSLWCDGIDHCPSGFDEAAKHCSFILQLPLLYLALGAAGILVICCSFCLITCSACRGRRRSKHHSRIKSLSSDTSTFGKEVICWHSDNSVRYEEVDRVTTVWQRRCHLPRAWIRNSALCSMAASNRIFCLRHTSASVTSPTARSMKPKNFENVKLVYTERNLQAFRVNSLLPSSWYRLIQFILQNKAPYSVTQHFSSQSTYENEISTKKYRNLIEYNINRYYFEI